MGWLKLLDVLGLAGNPLGEGMMGLLETEGPQAVVRWLRDAAPGT